MIQSLFRKIKSKLHLKNLSYLYHIRANSDICFISKVQICDIFICRANVSISHSVMQRTSRLKCGKVFAA